MILLKEVDRPKSLGEKISEYLARPPLPILRFYGESRTQVTNERRHILFAVRNGLPFPLLYGIYVETKYDSFADYIEKVDHIGPWSTDDWRLTLDSDRPAQVEIRAGLVPAEILTDRIKIAI